MRTRIGWVSAAWAVVVIAIYYRKAWALLLAGPDAGASVSFGFGDSPVAFPFLGDALFRGARGIGAATLVALAIWSTGAMLVGRLTRVGIDRGERVVLVASFGTGTLGLLLYAMALCGAYRPAIVTGMLLVLAAAGAGRMAVRGSSTVSRRAGLKSCSTGDDVQSCSTDDEVQSRDSVQDRDVAQAFRPALQQPGWIPIERWAAPIAILALALAFFCALTPESEYDALWYHLELPRRWLAAGHPVDDVSEYVSLYPLQWELVLGAALPLGGSVGAKLLHWLMLPASAAVAMLWARRLQAPPWLAAAIFATAPTVFWESTTAYADLALALHVGVGTWALLRAFEERSRGWLMIAGIAFGFACATKHLGLVALASSLAVFAVAAIATRVPIGRALANTAMVGAVAVALAAPWYAWAVARSGNPVFPELYAVFGAQPPERWSAHSEDALRRFKAHFGRSRSVAHQLTLPWDMTVHAAEYGGTYGPLLLALAPAAVVVVSRSRAARALAAGTALYFLVWASPVSSFQARFLVPAWLGASPLLALAAARAMPPAVNGLLVAVLLLNLPPATTLHEGDRKGWTHWLTHVVRDVPAAAVLGGISQDEYLRRQVRSYAAWQWIDAHLPPDARVLTFSGGDQYYSRRARLWSDSDVAWQATWGAQDATDAVKALHALAITHVLVPQPRIRSATADALPLVDLTARAGPLVRIYEDLWYALYRVDDRAGAAVRSTDHR